MALSASSLQMSGPQKARLYISVVVVTPPPRPSSGYFAIAALENEHRW